MNTPCHDIVMRNRVFGWIALLTGLLLLVPLVTMQFTSEVAWDVTDFIVMGGLLFGAGSLFVLVARRVPRAYWLGVGLLVAAGLLLVWAELAVGVFTHLGS